MNLKRQTQFVLFVWVVLIVSFANAAVRYGEAQIKNGEAIIAREGKVYQFSSNDNPVSIFENDVIRMKSKSSLTLTNLDQNRILLGSNAIMQVKKWKKKDSSGMLRMLFGKFRARTTKQRKDRFLKLRTATATIGIKGSLGEGVTGPDFTSLANLGGEIDLDDTQIPLGEIAFKVDNIHFQIQIFKNPNYAPDVPEDEQETSKPDSLDTTDPKLSEPDPAVKKAVSKYVVKVTREGDPSGAPWNPMDEYKKDYQNVTNTEKVRVNIEVEP